MRVSIWATLIPVIGVEDLERTTRFYTEALGFALVHGAGAGGGKPAFAHLRHGAVELVVYALDPDTIGMMDRVGRKKMHLYIAVSDVDALSAELRIRRIRVSPPVNVGDGRYCDVEDPDGYLLRFGNQLRPVPFDNRLLIPRVSGEPYLS